HALPMPFGLKLAGYAAALARSRERLRRLRRAAMALQIGGAVGTLAALNDRGLDVAERLAALLDLPLPEAPWHSHRDRLAEVASALAILAGSCGKIARDVSLLMQTDVAEAFEPAAPGRGGSSTMPHKRNPVAAAVVLAAAARAPGLVATLLTAMVQEHERGLGGWHAEWQTLPELCVLAAGALRRTVEAVEGLEVDAARMRQNLEATRGQMLAEAVVLALGSRIGRLEAHTLVERACHRAAATGLHLRDVLAADGAVAAHLAAADLDRLLDPQSYTGASDRFVDRVLKHAAGRGADQPESVTDGEA
ncbi:MAG: 3-carboxy-cis,cis-muconate cycloisomerase, partial [Acidobacteria bacterium]